MAGVPAGWGLECTAGCGPGMRVLGRRLRAAPPTERACVLSAQTSSVASSVHVFRHVFCSVRSRRGVRADDSDDASPLCSWKLISDSARPCLEGIRLDYSILHNRFRARPCLAVSSHSPAPKVSRVKFERKEPTAFFYEVVHPRGLDVELILHSRRYCCLN